mgnify:CR=1 FL=1
MNNLYKNIEPLIANEVYKQPRQRKTILERYYVIDERFNDKYVVVYVNRRTGEAIMGIRGTDPTKLRDIITDIRMGIGQDLEGMGRYKEIENAYHKFIKKYPHNSRVVGHSLGANIGEVIARKNPYKSQFSLFNKGASPLMKQEELENAFIRNYRIEKDPISFLGKKGLVLKPKEKGASALDRHSIEQFINRN